MYVALPLIYADKKKLFYGITVFLQYFLRYFFKMYSVAVMIITTEKNWNIFFLNII